MDLGGLEKWLDAVASFVWGPALLVLLLGTGGYLTVAMGFMPIRRIGAAFRLLVRGGAQPRMTLATLRRSRPC